jgi:competence protein ComFC
VPRLSFPAAGRALEVFFPGRCLLCGEWLPLAGDHWVPLCDECGNVLPGIGEPRCTRCGIQLISEKGTCLRCRAADFSFDSNMSLFPYDGPAKQLLNSLKFGRRTRLARFFADHAAGALKERCLEGVVLVPAPPRPGRRAPDAVELVARALEHRHGVPVRRLLTREGFVQQKSLDYEQRKANLKGKIRLGQTDTRTGVPREVLLLDDVFTTGATLDACALVLREAGCSMVRALTLVIEE